MRGGVSVLYVEFEDDRVKELFDDLNDVRKSENLMRKAIVANYEVRKKTIQSNRSILFVFNPSTVWNRENGVSGRRPQRVVFIESIGKLSFAHKTKGKRLKCRKFEKL